MSFSREISNSSQNKYTEGEGALTMDMKIRVLYKTIFFPLILFLYSKQFFADRLVLLLIAHLKELTANLK